jgi:hypothetical protein
MQLTREDFDPVVVSAMDEIATLVYACHALHKAGATFANAPELDRSEAEPDAETALMLCREMANDLLLTTTRKPKRLDALLLSDRRNAAVKIEEAIACVRRLADQETEAMMAAGANGNWIRKRVLAPLVSLQSVWSASNIENKESA